MLMLMLMNPDDSGEFEDEAVRSAFERWLESHERAEPVAFDQLASDLSPSQTGELKRRFVDHKLRAALGRPDRDVALLTPPGFGAKGKAERYENLRELGQGGMGVVYLARDIELDRLVAYKVMKPEGDTAETVRRFAHEAEITAMLQYPGIVPVFGRVTDDSGRPAYAMGYVDGSTFREELQLHHGEDPPRPLPVLLVALATACRIVEFAHSQKVVHGDLSPKNLMIARSGATHVVDWGLAHRVGSESFGKSAGTPGYTAPSIIRDGLRTERTDIYSLGAILAAIVLGIKPDGRPDLDGPKSRVVPRPLRAIIDAAMTEPGEGRKPTYPTAGSLADDLDRYLAGEAVAAYPEPWFDRTWRRIRRRPARATAAVASVVILLLGVASASTISAARAIASAAQDRTTAAQSEAALLAEKARYSHLEALESQAAAAFEGYNFITVQPGFSNLAADNQKILASLKVIKMMVKEPKQVEAADRLMREMVEIQEQNKTAEQMGNLGTLKIAEQRVRKGVEVLEELRRDYPEKEDRLLDLASFYWVLAFIESDGLKIQHDPNVITSLLARDLLASLTGVRLDKTKLEGALALVDKAEGILRDANPDLSHPMFHSKLRRMVPMLRTSILNRLGRYSEALIAHDQSLLDPDPIDRPLMEAERMIYRMGAEKEQEKMPWSVGAHVDHAHAIAMAGYLADDPSTSNAAIFNCSCAFSLASLDPKADPAEKERRAARAVALLARIADDSYFRGAKQIKEFHNDYALNPLRNRPDFLALKDRLASQGSATQ